MTKWKINHEYYLCISPLSHAHRDPAFVTMTPTKEILLPGGRIEGLSQTPGTMETILGARTITLATARPAR